MDLVSRDDVGDVAIARMARDGVVVPLGPCFAAPLDLPLTVDDRAIALAEASPSHTVVSGLAALWVRFGGSRPSVLNLVGRPGLHRAPPGFHPRGWRLAFHSGPAHLEGVPIAGVRIAPAGRAAADALRWDDLAEAIPAVVRSIREGDLDPADVDRLVRGADPRGAGAARMRSAWAAIAASAAACRRSAS